MDKRYQVFVSSTFADLKDERQRVTQTLMEMDCIPAGMELFPALDEEQWEFIKRVIDDCDYYILIIGGRYGSLTADGISYTEKEYDYAISIGLKVMAFVHERPDDIPVGKSDINADLRQKLEDFRSKVTCNRLVKFWTKANELPGMVALSLSKTIKTYPAIGWVRADNIANEEVLSDVNDLRKENDRLRSKLRELENQEPPESLNLAGLDEPFEFQVTWYRSGEYARRYYESLTATWSDIFAALAPSLVEHPNDEKANGTIASGMYRRLKEQDSSPTGIKVVTDDFETMRVQLTTLGLIDVNYNQSTRGSMALFWTITRKGQQLLLSLRTVKSNK
ncbi:hypothetical protein Pla100_34000 [Neorhodopirellula pilleata]|uniref:DUF4062 domain-containing protein n=1 Tax=Neorhodopirellula pilleata TaxID=2714738 RepID=A0A5C6A8V4_9BACT|nr:hypothetical protein Pla100_34000 [Neorhodopirellula pilleata]